MKKFFSLTKFKELSTLLVLSVIIALLLLLLIGQYPGEVNYWSWKAAGVTLMIWIITSVLESEKSFNLATFLGISPIIYLIFWVLFNTH